MTDLHTAPTVDLSAPSERGAPSEPGALPEPGARGLLDIARSVPEKIARRVAGEVDGTVGRVNAEADLSPGRVTVRLELGVEYPRPVGEVAAEVQRRVAHRVSELTGLTVEAVDVTVAELPAPSRGRAKPRVI
ncbi:MAG TPA: Asp23/Gls24 family envelope stress response protein [Acidimicrobiales bacterium]|nr:Asp23/Gls24 family envelope stress response protein [Acidimicrobiales bacterium]